MKTPRDLLLECHQAVDPRLDALRRAVLDNRFPSRVSPPRRSTELGRWIVALVNGFRPFHRQLAAMAALWALAAVLNGEFGSDPGLKLAGQNPPAPHQILAALRENRRQVWELIQGPVAPPPPSVPQAGVPVWGEAEIIHVALA